jgi:hypothetical protein
MRPRLELTHAIHHQHFQQERALFVVSKPYWEHEAVIERGVLDVVGRLGKLQISSEFYRYH